MKYKAMLTKCFPGFVALIYKWSETIHRIVLNWAKIIVRPMA